MNLEIECFLLVFWQSYKQNVNSKYSQKHFDDAKKSGATKNSKHLKTGFVIKTGPTEVSLK